MSVHATHYVVYGVAITDEKKVKDFFALEESHDDLLHDEYYDNPYKEEITPTKSGIHIIVDGMNSGYVVIGKIIAKGLENGLEFTKVPLPYKKQTKIEGTLGSGLLRTIIDLDKILGTKFRNLTLQYLVFTHWH